MKNLWVNKRYYFEWPFRDIQSLCWHEKTAKNKVFARKIKFTYFKDQSECFTVNSQSQEASSTQGNSQTNSKPQKKIIKKHVSSTKPVSNLLTTGQDNGEEECKNILIY